MDTEVASLASRTIDERYSFPDAMTKDVLNVVLGKMEAAGLMTEPTEADVVKYYETISDDS